MNALKNKLQVLEAKNVQPAMLQAVKSFNEDDRPFYAAWLCLLALRGVLHEPCAEVNRMYREVCDKAFCAVPEALPENHPLQGMSDDFLTVLILCDVFNSAPRAWRVPGAETKLIKTMQQECPELREMSLGDAKAHIENEIARLEKLKNEYQNQA